MYVWFKLLMLDHTQKLTFLSILKKFKNSKIQIIELKFCLCYQKTPAQRTSATTLKQITDAKTESTHFLFYVLPNKVVLIKSCMVFS